MNTEIKSAEEMYLDLDMECAKLEDHLHGEDGMQISWIRKLLGEYHAQFNSNAGNVWVKASEKSPEHNSHVYVRLKNGIKNVALYQKFWHSHFHWLSHGRFIDDKIDFWLYEQPIAAQQPIKSDAVGDVEKADTEMFYQRNIQNPYPSDSQSYTAFKKGFELGWQAKQQPVNKVNDVNNAADFPIGTFVFDSQYHNEVYRKEDINKWVSWSADRVKLTDEEVEIGEQKRFRLSKESREEIRDHYRPNNS